MNRVGTALLLLACACSREDAEPRLQITDARARATVPGQTASAAYLTIENRGDGADRLTGVAVDGAQASIHSSSMAGGVMRMRPLPALPIPPHSSTALQPAGRHIMIAGLSKPLAAGGTLALTLRFERSGAQPVTAKIVADPSGDGGGEP